MKFPDCTALRDALAGFVARTDRRPGARNRTRNKLPGYDTSAEPRNRPSRTDLGGLSRRAVMTTVAVVAVLGLALVAITEQSVVMSFAMHMMGRSEAAHATKAAHGTRESRAVPDATVSSLVPAVRAATLAVAKRDAMNAAGARPLVTVETIAQGWAVGTTAIAVPAGEWGAPWVSLFLARADGPRWQVALSGMPAFASLAGGVPTSVMPAAERDALTPGAHGLPPDLMLPWAAGQSWTMRSSPGGLLFSGTSSNVLAAGAGWLYRACTSEPGQALILLVHPGGVITTYYQMDDVTSVPDGSSVAAGQYLGQIGTDLPCGGQPADPGVQFSIYDAGDTPRVGGWLLTTGLSASARLGMWQYGSGAELENYGLSPAYGPPSTTGTPPVQ
jgi:LasA protease